VEVGSTRLERHAVIVYPFLNVVRPELVHGQASVDGLAERLKPVLVPAVCVWRPVLLRPVQKLIDDQKNERPLSGGGLDWCGRLIPLLHQAVIGLECSGLIGAKIDLPPINLDVLESTGSAKERVGIVRHDENLQAHRASPRGLPGPRRLQPAGGFHSLTHCSDIGISATFITP
jgi:hypothetical protein